MRENRYHAHMANLTYHTAGESHGPAVTCLIYGLPAGLVLDIQFINAELTRRQGGYGRGGRQKIENDKVTFIGGVRLGKTTGGPVAIQIPNKDSRLDDLSRTPPVYRPRPGHADLAGSVKWLTTDCRNSLERASARETAARTAAGAVAQCLLKDFGIETFGFVRGLLDANTDVQITENNLIDIKHARNQSEVYCPDVAVSEKIIAHIRQAKIDKDTLGGLAEVHVLGCPIGLGTCAHWDEKLDARIAFAVMSIQAFKAVEIGLGKECATRPGSQVQDPIEYDQSKRGQPSAGFVRPSNNAGGIEGGMTNGMPIVVRGTMKPISTLLQGMPSVDLNTKQAERSSYERSDVCALPAASVVMQGVVALEVARSFLDKFGGDTMHELRANYENYLATVQRLPLDKPIDAGGLEADQTEA